MAKFCTRCGSPVEETLKFCPKCGAQLGALSAPAPAAAGATPTARPPAQPPAGAAAGAPAAKAGSPILKIILIVLGLFAFVTVVGIGSCFYVGYRVKKKAEEVKQTFKVDESGKSVTINTPSGAITLGEKKGGEAAKTATVDVPPYPGSTPTEGGGGISVGGQGGFSTQEYVTADPVDKVLTFYKDKFGSRINIVEAEGNAEFTLMTSNGMNTVTITRDADAGKTKISIAHVGK